MSTPEADEMEPQSSSEEEEDSETEPESAPSGTSSSSSSSDSDSDADADSGSRLEPDSDDERISVTRPDGTVQKVDVDDPDLENTPEVNILRYNKLLNSKRRLREEEEDELNRKTLEDHFNFPPDPENWREEDLKELWADAPLGMTKPGWDPHDVDEEEVEVLRDEIREGGDPPIAPFYVPYRKYYPMIPHDNYDIQNAKSVIEELDRIEEFLNWVSYIFPNGSSYEGTVWDDLAHGKGVYVAEQGLVRYEGEWFRNQMEGHGVIEVDIPQIEPIPGSKLEAQMRAEGNIISRDFMSPEDREWLEMDIEDSLKLAEVNDGFEIPWYENDMWIKVFGSKPEKGRYRYAGQWKHGRMHGCGVYEVNERTIWGRFYFGELLDDPAGCDAELSAMHSGIAEVAAAKARMFVNKPNGMVREDRGPYSDPQHPYLYEEEDVWMAPGFINQFYEVPDYWKMYVHEVDQEREMWLNSFYRAPLRLPMPAELEHWWANDKTPEFILINKEPEPDPENPSKLIYTEDPLILHTPTGRIINYIDDEEHGIRLFWQPKLEEGEEPHPDMVEFLPLGDDLDGASSEKDSFWGGLLKSIENSCKPWLDKLDKLAQEMKKTAETREDLYKKEMELIEAELTLKEAVEDLDEALKVLQKEEENKLEQEDEDEEDATVSEAAKQNTDQAPMLEAEEDEGEEEDEEDTTASSFGSIEGENSKSNDQKESNGKTKFASASLSLGTFSLVSLVPQKLQNPFLRRKESKFEKQQVASLPSPTYPYNQFETQRRTSVCFPVTDISLKMTCGGRQTQQQCVRRMPKLRNQSKTKSSTEWREQAWEDLGILSLHTPITM